MKKFYVVMRDSDGRPLQVRHNKYSEALTEAERLCIKENDRFFVLMLSAIIQPIQPRVEVLYVE